jgi:hypothetical protein
MRAVFLSMAALALSACGNIYSPLSPNPQPTPVPHIKPYGSLDDFEDQNTTNDFGKQNAIWTDSLGSSMFADHSASGSTLTAGTAGYAVRLYGMMKKNIDYNPPNNLWPYTVYEMDIAFGSGRDITAFAPLKRLAFHYKASAGDVGKQHRVTVTHYPITDYSWYYYTFTPTNTNWNELKVYFPTAAGTPKLAQTWGVPVPWANVQPKVTTVTFMPFSSNSADLNYDFTIDDVRFE